MDRYIYMYIYIYVYICIYIYIYKDGSNAKQKNNYPAEQQVSCTKWYLFGADGCACRVLINKSHVSTLGLQSQGMLLRKAQ